MRRNLYFFLIFTLGPVLGACMAFSPSEKPLNTVPMVAVGGGPLAEWGDKEPGGLWIASEEKKELLASRRNKDANLPGRVPAVPEIDFSEYGVLLIWMGRQPTGGFALELMADEAEIEKRTAVVPVRWIEPQKGAMVIQMVTNPFLSIRIAKGGFDQIAVVDPNGVSRVVVKTIEK
jgi:hypothetical protein